MNARLLIVDDEPHILAALKRTLRLVPPPPGRTGITIEAHTDAATALDRLRVCDHDLVLSDLRMPLMDGLTFLHEASQLRPHAVRMVLTGSADFHTAQRAINEARVFRYICKPWTDAELVAEVADALAQAQQSRAQREAAQAWQDHRDAPSAEELERRRLEALEPGLTHVDWGPTGEVLMPSLSTFGRLGPG